MPYKHTLPEVLLMLFTNPPEAARIIGIMGLGGIARACLNSSSGLLKRIGDISCCVLMFYCIKPFIPIMPTIFGVQVSRGTIAIAISLLGTHVIYALIRFFFKRRTGADLKEIEKNG
ncbi:hypothetical protein [Enterobacter quasiroggenkampii]|uniref:hypothetical protein n=1 Tax=Enterobacter quasiroggenkampii TaxID=2497436 RepID=UPI001F24421C|nr:hypothetical protein [Enterobacter quasiroggenkampii]